MAQQGHAANPPAIAAGNAAAQPAIANVGAAQPDAPIRTFRQVLTTKPDVFHGNYSGLLSEYAVTGTPPRTGVEVMETTLRRFPTEQVPNLFLYLGPEGVLRTVCFIHTVETLFGQPPGPWDDVVLALASEVTHGQVTPVIVPDEFFSITPATVVPTMATMQAQWLAVPQQRFMNPFPAGTAATDSIQSRRAVPVPSLYAAFFLHQSRKPSEAWDQVGTHLLLHGKEQECGVFLNFLRMSAVAATIGATGVRSLPHLAMPVAMVPPLADEVLHNHLHRRLLMILPGLAMPVDQDHLGQQILQGTALIRATIQDHAAAQQAERVTARMEDKSPKTFTEAYRGMAPALRKLCGAGDDDERLPDFWKIFAAVNGKKNQGFPALEQLLTARANENDSSMVQPILPAMLYEYISLFRLGSRDLENISHGLSPFLMCPVGYHKAASQEALNLQYTMVYGEGGVAGLADVKQILSSAAYNIPSDLLQLLEFIGAYSVTLDVLIGVDEPLPRALYHHFKFWQRTISAIGSALPDKASHVALITGVMRAIQLTAISYINTTMNLTAMVVRGPDFSHIENAITNRMFQTLPPLPAHYFTTPRSQPPVPTPTAAAPRAPAIRTTGLPVIAPVAELHPAFLEAFASSDKRISDLKSLPAARTLLTSNKSSTLCLSYHLKGNCFDNCQSSQSHRLLVASEQNALKLFVTQHL
jgi:hypothetical protein